MFWWFFLVLPFVLGEFHARTFDIVYTWVNGSDVFLLDQMKKVMPQSKVPTGRVQDREELRYSLRSLEQFMPWWEGRLIILTNHEPPSWLNLSTPRLMIVSHPDIWENASLLPTFNSDGIEHHLRRLPDLSEQFIYFNDDMILASPVLPDHFWSESGRPRVRFTQNIVRFGKQKHDELLSRREKQWQANIFYTHELVDNYYAAGKDYFLHHTPYPMLKSVLNQIYEKFPSEVQIPIHCRQRCFNSLQIPSMHHWIAVRQGFADPIWNSSALHQYIFIKTTNFVNFTAALKSIKPETLFYNLADYPSTHDFHEAVSSFLTERYPIPSHFELATAAKTVFELEREQKSPPPNVTSANPTKFLEEAEIQHTKTMPPVKRPLKKAVQPVLRRHILPVLERLQEAMRTREKNGL